MPITSADRPVIAPAPHPATPDGLRTDYDALLAAMPATDAPLEAWLAFFWRWETLKRGLDGDVNRRRFRERQDTRDEGAREAMREAREAILPLLEPYEASIRAAMLAAGCRPALEKELGEQVFIRFATAQAAYTPANIPLHVAEGQVAADYMRLMGEANVVIDGETLNLMQLVARTSDPDEATRRTAHAGLVGWLGDHAEDFHGLYDKFIALRQEMAENLGEENFIALGYRRLGRSDYGPAECAAFREEIRQHVVPVYAKFRAWQAKALGTATVHPGDAEFYPGLSLPPGVVPVADQLDRATTLFEALDPRLAAHFKRMVERNMIDVPARPGKATGAFCTVFEDTGDVAIFCNATGDSQDLITLTHEMGHAFQCAESLPIPTMELRWPGMDAAEVLSMGLELLVLPHMGAFLDADMAAKYRRLLLVTVLFRLPYMAVVDGFQHWVYANPKHTHATREAKWDELWQQFMPGVDGGHRTRWMRQLHIFQLPFYYIDYALAETGALQLWARAETDHEGALDAYMALCRLGGTQPLVGFFESAGLQSPFTPGVLGPLMARVAAGLDL